MIESLPFWVNRILSIPQLQRCSWVHSTWRLSADEQNACWLAEESSRCYTRSHRHGTYFEHDTNVLVPTIPWVIWYTLRSQASQLSTWSQHGTNLESYKDILVATIPLVMWYTSRFKRLYYPLGHIMVHTLRIIKTLEYQGPHWSCDTL